MKNYQKKFYYSRIDDYILYYEIIDDQIIVHYANYEETESFPYSTEEINRIENLMKEQILSSKSKIDDFRSKNKNEYFWQLYNCWFMYISSHNYMNSQNTPQKIIQGFCFLSFVSLFILRSKTIIDRKELIKEFEKYKYFIENEDIINYEYYMSQNQNSMISSYEIPRISINDIQNTSIQELKEIVELITTSYKEDVYKLKKKN